jgi:hypothetical protein
MLSAVSSLPRLPCEMLPSFLFHRGRVILQFYSTGVFCLLYSVSRLLLFHPQMDLDRPIDRQGLFLIHFS